MDKNKAIPEGYMTVGEVARKMKTTVRTLQYYDRERLLAPSAESEGGRRLYTDKDIVKLHQIQSMKYLGFSLDDIKNRLTALETPEDVAAALNEQEKLIRGRIAALSEVLRAVEMLRAETLKMRHVNFKKYAAIVVNLQMKNDFYWMVKHFDDETLDAVQGRFDMDSGMAIMRTMSRLCAEAEKLQKEDVPCGSERGQAFAKAWWDMVVQFTGGDMKLLPKLMELSENLAGEDGDLKRQWSAVEGYISKTMEAYFTNLGYNPFEEAGQ
ncbi:MAG: MerR family transcriptional regulator [Clostridiales bacterium]|jgi:DNA-binding transcriptional MerR regulator|nr:MerR family transcriptional regulator [Clostridiales bacterium]